MDFTLTTYIGLLTSLAQHGFKFSKFDEYLLGNQARRIVLRHDVDLLPVNSLEFARIQSALGIKGSYYFRIIPESFNENIIREISSMGHEVGYHYEDLSLAHEKLSAEGGWRKAEGEGYERILAERGIETFMNNLEKLRKIVPVKTICMHGSPMSKWDSRLMWKYYDYYDFGIMGEPYFDINFDEVMYLTDTGRRWDGDSFNVRDKVQGKGLRAQTAEHSTQDSEKQAPSTQHPAPFPHFHSTFDIIHAASEGKLPDKIMMTFHPQRWTDKPIPWVKELVWQNCKNAVKYFIVKSGNL